MFWITHHIMKKMKTYYYVKNEIYDRVKQVYLNDVH